jgi:competence protein ComEA
MKLSRIVATGLALVMATVLCAGPVLAAAAKPGPSAKINLNTATVEQLSAVPGVGPKLAARIVEHRQKEGSFRSVSELMNVKGIDPVR